MLGETRFLQSFLWIGWLIEAPLETMQRLAGALVVSWCTNFWNVFCFAHGGSNEKCCHLRLHPKWTAFRMSAAKLMKQTNIPRPAPKFLYLLVDNCLQGGCYTSTREGSRENPGALQSHGFPPVMMSRIGRNRVFTRGPAERKVWTKSRMPQRREDFDACRPCLHLASNSFTILHLYNVSEMSW